MLFNRTDEGLESLGPPQRILLDANWKTAGEQSGVDGFHTLTLHRSLMEVGQFGRNADDIYANAPAMYGIDIGTEQGHGFRCIPPENTFGSLMGRSEEHTSELQSLMRISYAVFCLKKKNKAYIEDITTQGNQY